MAATKQIHIPPKSWQVRPHQEAVWTAMQKRVPNILMIGHRRFGKDELGLMDMAWRAAGKAANYLYMLPESEHVRRAIWSSINPHTGRRRIDESFPEGFRIGSPKEQEMVLEVHSTKSRNTVAMNEPDVQHYRSRVQFLGSDNYDALLSISAFGITISEWALADPQAVAMLRPIVAENGGFFRFLTTARGKNHAYRMLQDNAGKPEWAVFCLPCDQTGVFTQQQLNGFLQENISLYGPEVGTSLYQQEYFCSFEEIVAGSFYIDLLLKAEQEGRIGPLARSIEEPVYAAFDLGYSDATAIWYAQIRQNNVVDILAYEEYHKTSIPELIPKMRRHPWFYGGLLLPHDARQHQLTSGETVETILTKAGFSCYVMPQQGADAENLQIHSVRMLLPRCQFHADDTRRGLDCLRHFHNKPKTDAGGGTTWSPKPVHDWASHGAKAMATLAHFAPVLRRGPKSKALMERDFWGDRPPAMQERGAGWMT